MADRLGLLHDALFGLGGLVLGGFLGLVDLLLGALLDVQLRLQRLDGLAELGAGLLDVGLDVVLAGLRARLGTGDSVRS